MHHSRLRPGLIQNQLLPQDPNYSDIILVKSLEQLADTEVSNFIRTLNKKRGELIRGNMKGAAWINNRNYIIQKFGDEGINKVKEAMEAKDRELLFEKPVTSVSWIDYPAYLRFMLIADKLLGKADFELINETTAYDANISMKGIYKIFLKLASPQGVMKNFAKVWRQIFDKGSAEYVELGQKKGGFKIIDYPDIPLNHEKTQDGFIREVFKMTGKKNIKAYHEKCMARGDDHCLFSYTWD